MAACQFPSNEQGRPQGLLEFRIEQFHPDSNFMDVRFTIKNESDRDWKGGEWSLHWNQISGVIDSASLPNGVRFEWVNGNSYFVLYFDSLWTIKAGEERSFHVIQRGIMPRLALGPVGVFGVMREHPFPLTTTIKWQEAKGLEALNLPTSESRFREYEHINPNPPETLAWLVPTPKEAVQVSGFRPAPEAFTGYMDPAFRGEKPRLETLVNDLYPNWKWVAEADKASLSLLFDSALAPEGYRLRIDSNRVHMAAKSYSGLVYALQSLKQIEQIASREQLGWPILEIHDAPRFAYRGFLLDIARNYYGPAKIKKVIDLLSLFKLNRLELKLTDDEGWRLEIPGLPELTEIGGHRGYTKNEQDRLIPMYGSGADGGATGNGYLTRDHFIELLRYAHARNITIIPQISFPTHARAAVVAMTARRQRFAERGNPTEGERYALSDPYDGSMYRSAQLYNDNIINICLESSFAFFAKVVDEVDGMYAAAGVPFEQMSIGADELPKGAWEGSLACAQIADTASSTSVSALYDVALHRLKNLLHTRGIALSGWEDFLLEHSSDGENETRIKSDRFNHEVIPYVWNNLWKGGREDMVYKFANDGFRTVMCNSSAFYFDMVDDADMHQHGLSWSGYVDYFDTWALDPEDLFANDSLNRKHGIDSLYVASTTRLQPESRNNLWGIQSQLFTETVRSEEVLDALLVPNLLFFAERAWAPRPDWMSWHAGEQLPAQLKDWHAFLHLLGRRTLPMVQARFEEEVCYALPAVGGVVLGDTLKLASSIPGFPIHYTFDGTAPTSRDPKYEGPVIVPANAVVKARVFDITGREGRVYHINR